MINGRCPPVARKCDSHSVFAEAHDSKEKRSVLLVSGDASTLFARYLGEAEKKGLRLDLEALSIIYYDQGAERRELEAGVSVKMGLGQLLANMTMEQVWKHALRGRTAGDLPDPEGEGLRIGADVVCGRK
jgi:hypothetical protein